MSCLTVFHAGEALFHTGWFIESMATQVLVIFIIRTRKNPFKSRPHPWLIACSLAVVAWLFSAVYPCGSLPRFCGAAGFFLSYPDRRIIAYLRRWKG